MTNLSRRRIPSSQRRRGATAGGLARRARSASPIGRSLTRRCAERREAADGVARGASPAGRSPNRSPAKRLAELTTPALRATPPLRGGEYYGTILLALFCVTLLVPSLLFATDLRLLDAVRRGNRGVVREL